MKHLLLTLALFLTLISCKKEDDPITDPLYDPDYGITIYRVTGPSHLKLVLSTYTPNSQLTIQDTFRLSDEPIDIIDKHDKHTAYGDWAHMYARFFDEDGRHVTTLREHITINKINEFNW